MSPSIVPSQKGAPTAANLPTATAIYDSAARHFVIQPTPWGTLLSYRRIIHAAFPWGPIDAYIELPLSDSVEDKGKLLDTNIARIKIESSEVVPVGAFLARVYGDDEVWMLHFPPQPLAAGLDECLTRKKGVKSGAKTSSANEGKCSNGQDLEESSFGNVCPTYVRFYELLNKKPSDTPEFLDNFFTAYAMDVGSGLTPNDVRVDFANDLVGVKLLGYHPEKDDSFWEFLWSKITRDGTLKGIASSHWSRGFDKMDPPKLSKVEQALGRQGKEPDVIEQYIYAVSRAMTRGFGEETLKTMANMWRDEEFVEKARRLDPRLADKRYFDDFYSIWTQRGTLDGLPKHREDKL